MDRFYWQRKFHLFAQRGLHLIHGILNRIKATKCAMKFIKEYFKPGLSQGLFLTVTGLALLLIGCNATYTIWNEGGRNHVLSVPIAAFGLFVGCDLIFSGAKALYEWTRSEVKPAAKVEEAAVAVASAKRAHPFFKGINLCVGCHRPIISIGAIEAIDGRDARQTSYIYAVCTPCTKIRAAMSSDERSTARQKDIPKIKEHALAYGGWELNAIDLPEQKVAEIEKIVRALNESIAASRVA